MEEEKKEEVVETPVVPTQEEKDENYFKLKKSNNRKKALLVILLFIIVLMGILLFIFLTDKKEEAKPVDNNTEEKKEENKQEEKNEQETSTTVKENLPSDAVIEASYSTKDGKDYIKVMSKDDKATYNEAKRIYERVEELYRKETNSTDVMTYEESLKYLPDGETIKKYIWHNNMLFEVFIIDEDDTYVLYVANRVNSLAQGQGYYFFLANKKEKFLVPSLNLEDRGDYYTDYQVFNGSLNFYKTKAGYFFAIEGYSVSTCASADLYTTSWKPVGYFYSGELESDEKGVYVYEKYLDHYDENTEKCLNEKTKIKVDINGNKIN